MKESLLSVHFQVESDASRYLIKDSEKSSGTDSTVHDLFIRAKYFLRQWHKNANYRRQGISIDPISSEEAQTIEHFFDLLKVECLKSQVYPSRKKAENIAYINKILLYIPWYDLPEARCKDYMNDLFSDTVFREQFWDYYTEKCCRYVDKSPQRPNPVDGHFIREFLQYPEIWKDFLSVKSPAMVKLIVGSLANAFPNSLLPLLDCTTLRELILQNKDLFGYLVWNNTAIFEAYCRTLFINMNQTLARDKRFELALGDMFMHFALIKPLTPGLYLLLREQHTNQRELSQLKFDDNYTSANPEEIANLINQAYNHYFRQPSPATAKFALKVFENLIREPYLSTAMRFQAIYYTASLHIDFKQFGHASVYLSYLTDAGTALTTQQHENVFSFQLLCRQRKDDSDHYSQDIFNLVPEKQKVSNNLFLERQKVALQHQIAPYLQVVRTLNEKLGDYLSNRDTQGIFYSLGIKNATLSNKKNEMVAKLRADLDTCIQLLHQAQSMQQFKSIQVNLTQVLNAAIQRNQELYSHYGRIIDGIGILGADLQKTVDTLSDFRPSSNLREEPLIDHEQPSISP